MRKIQLLKNGIRCQTNSFTVYLDPKKINSDGINFISHAHIDHLPNGGTGKVLASNETNEIAKFRGFSFVANDNMENFSLIAELFLIEDHGLILNMTLKIFYILE